MKDIVMCKHCGIALADCEYHKPQPCCFRSTLTDGELHARACKNADPAEAALVDESTNSGPALSSLYGILKQKYPTYAQLECGFYTIAWDETDMK